MKFWVFWAKILEDFSEVDNSDDDVDFVVESEHDFESEQEEHIPVQMMHQVFIIIMTFTQEKIKSTSEVKSHYQ